MYDIPYMWNLKRNDTNELKKQKETHRLRELTYGCSGNKQGEGIVGSLGWTCIHCYIHFRITNKQIQGENVEAVTDFLSLGSKIIADSDYSHEIKRCLLLGRNAMTSLDNILKSRGTTLPIKVCLVKAMIFPVIMYGCESWTIMEAEH